MPCIASTRRLLFMLGGTPNYAGFRYVIYALKLLSENNEMRLQLVTKWLYPDIAKHYQTEWKTVERDIRTLIGVIWKRNPILLQYIAGYPMNHKPTVSQFFGILWEYLSSSYPKTLIL